MNNEEAIELLSNVNAQSPLAKALSLAVKSLEKQIPQKPKYVEVERDTMDMETGEEYKYKIDEAHCSCCDFIIGVEYDIFDECYCENCGQAIDWSEEGEQE